MTAKFDSPRPRPSPAPTTDEPALDPHKSFLDARRVFVCPSVPDYVEALFDYALGQLRAEAEWVARTLAYMTSKPWLE